MIALYFGSFNPLHYGHLAVAEYVIRHIKPSRLVMVLSPHNPFKNAADLEEPSRRLSDLRHQIAQFNESEGVDIEVSDIEFHRPEPLYTFDTLQLLKAQYADTVLAIVMGADSFVQLPSWYRGEDILREFKIIVYPREGSDVQLLASQYKNVAYLKDAPCHNISSTEIRRSRKNALARRKIVRRKIVFILNPHSGTQSKAEIPGVIEKTLDTQLYDYQIVFTEYAGHATKIAASCVEKNTDVVVAVGGDGTINEVARSLIHTNTALGLIPCGSGNGLARHLCIPLSVKKAIEILNRRHVESLDYGVINDRPFFCTCGMGFDAFISLKFAEGHKRGFITYLEKVLQTWITYKPELYEVEDETGTHHYKAFLIACANASQYGNNAFIAPKATMTDGLMDVTVIEPFTALDAMQISVDIFNKTISKSPKIRCFQAHSLRIRRSSPGAIHYDGDPTMMGRDINIHIENGGINILTNPQTLEIERRPNILLNIFSDILNGVNFGLNSLTKFIR